MRNHTKIILLISALIALLLLLFKQFPNALSNDEGKIALVSFTVILASMILRIADSSVRIHVFIVQLALWALIILAIITGYSYKLELKEFSDRLAANLMPSYGQEQEDGSIVFYAGNNGHFLINALLNDEVKVEFLFDTGASSVSLSSDAAKALGVDIDSLTYNVPLSTANGISWGARAMIDKIQVGPIIVYNVPATISQEGSLSTSLLGMTFLNKLERFEIQDNQLTLVN